MFAGVPAVRVWASEFRCAFSEHGSLSHGAVCQIQLAKSIIGDVCESVVPLWSLQCWPSSYFKTLTAFLQPEWSKAPCSSNIEFLHSFVFHLLLYLFSSAYKRHLEFFCFSGFVHICISCVRGFPLCCPLWPNESEFLCGAAAGAQVQHISRQQETSQPGKF